MWLEEEGFCELVKSFWEDNVSLGMVDLKGWKLRKIFVWCVIVLISMFDGEQNNIGLKMVAIGLTFSAIHNIKVNIEVTCELHADVSSVERAIVNFYENLYHEDHPSRSFLNGLSFSLLVLMMRGILNKISWRKKSG